MKSYERFHKCMTLCRIGYDKLNDDFLLDRLIDYLYASDDLQHKNIKICVTNKSSMTTY